MDQSSVSLVPKLQIVKKKPSSIENGNDIEIEDKYILDIFSSDRMYTFNEIYKQLEENNPIVVAQHWENGESENFRQFVLGHKYFEEYKQDQIMFSNCALKLLDNKNNNDDDDDNDSMSSEDETLEWRGSPIDEKWIESLRNDPGYKPVDYKKYPHLKELEKEYEKKWTRIFSEK